MSGDGAQAAQAARNQNGAQRTLPDGETDFGIRTAAAIFRRFHAQQLICLRVEAPAGVVAGAVDSRGDGSVVRERGAYAIGPLCQRVRAGGDPSDRLENALNVEPAESGVGRQRAQAGFPLGLLDDSAQFGHQRRVPCGQGCLIGCAAPAGAKAGALRIRNRAMKLHVLGACPARPTGGSAVNPGGLDRIEEFAVRRRVAGDHRRPARVVLRCRGSQCGALCG